MRRLCTCIAIPMVAALAATGCGGDAQRTVPEFRAPDARPRTEIPPGPAILETVRPYQLRRPLDFDRWQLAYFNLSGAGQLQWRVPFEWTIDRRSARSADGLVRARAMETTTAQDGVSMVDYLRGLSQGSPIRSYVNRGGYTVFVTSREVSLAPTNPSSPKSMFHTAVVDIGDHFIKLEVTYDAKERWRFRKLADAIVGTVEVEYVPPIG